MNAIALRIYVSAADAEFDGHPIVSVGEVVPPFTPLHPLIVDEPQSWMITHAQNYTLYSLHCKEIQGDSHAQRQVLVCLFMPAGQKFANGKSPLQLFDEVLALFHKSVKPNNTTVADASEFATLLQQYTLEERALPLPVMGGSEPAAYCLATQNQLKALMLHSRYPELAGIAQLELGFNCKTTVNLPLRTPKPKPTPKQVPHPTPKPVPKPVPQPRVSLVDDNEKKSASWLKKMLNVVLIAFACFFALITILAIIPDPDPDLGPNPVTEPIESTDSLIPEDSDATPIVIAAPVPPADSANPRAKQETKRAEKARQQIVDAVNRRDKTIAMDKRLWREAEINATYRSAIEILFTDFSHDKHLSSVARIKIHTLQRHYRFKSIVDVANTARTIQEIRHQDALKNDDARVAE